MQKRGMIGKLSLMGMFCLMAGYAHGQVVTKSTDTAATIKKPATPAPAAARLIKPKGPKPITNEVSGGLRLNTNGWSVYTDIGKIKAKNLKQADMFHNVRFMQIELTEKRSPKQHKLTSDGGQSGSTSYIYGKVNNFYALKLGYGLRKMIAGKPDPGSVSIHWVNAGGFALGMQKPYYLNVSSDRAAIKYSEDTKARFLDQYQIEGSAGFSKGLGEMVYNPGGHLKSALHFDFATNKRNAMAVEVGANAEFYSQKVLLMAGQPATNYFVDLFVALQFGKRW